MKMPEPLLGSNSGGIQPVSTISIEQSLGILLDQRTGWLYTCAIVETKTAEDATFVI